jgi:hypothetical protein
MQRVTGIDLREPESLSARHAEWPRDRADELLFLLVDLHQAFPWIHALPGRATRSTGATIR